MDKLKPILDQRFWILSGMAIILTFVGWSMGKSTLAAAIQARRDKLKAAFDSVAGSGANPNDKWTQQVAQRNTLQEKELKVSAEELYKIQQSRKFWPEGISAEAQKDYTKATPTDLEIYRAKYNDHHEQVWMMVQPLLENEDGQIVGKTNFPYERMARSNFGAVPPTPQQMYESQEDLWLYANLFTAISKINESATGQFDATLRELLELKIRGGDPDKIGESLTTASASPGSSMPSDNGTSSMPASGAGMEMLGASGGTGNSRYNLGKVDFNPDNEFGSDGSGSGGGFGAYPGTMPSSGPAGDMYAPGGATDSTAPTIKRYIREAPQWRTRGFYLKAIIDHRRLPDVIAGLTNAPWGIRITRVHQMDMQPDDLVDAAASGGPGGATPGGAFAPMPGGTAGMHGSGSPFAAGHGAGAMPGVGSGSSGPGFTGFSGLTGGFPGSSASPMPGAGLPGVSPDGMALEGNSAALNSVAMADPDLAVVAIDGWMVMYLPPPADASAPAEAASAAPTETPAPAAPAAIESTTPTTPATEGAPATTAAPPATPADGAAEKPAPTETPAEPKPEDTKPEDAKPAEPAPAEPAAKPAPAETPPPAAPATKPNE